ncbi:MAG: type II secretion system F family protein [Rhodobacteraceae bacterium]|nr:type II secretion system F family protein [Paracoccaceae bacterium]
MISTILEFITAVLGPLGPIIVAAGLGLFLILLSLPVILNKGEDPFAKLGSGGTRATGFKKKDGNTKGRLNLRYDSGKLNLAKFEAYLTPQNEDELTAARLKLLQAGYRSKGAVGNYNFLRMVLGISFLGLGLLYALIMSGELSALQVSLYVIMPGAVGYYLPTYWIERKRQTRQVELEDGFPDALDLMLVCVEAGQSLDQSIVRVATEIKHSNKALSEEFQVVANELRAGKERVSVLRDLGERCGVTDISSFVTVLVQSASFGTSISDALRVYAFEMRDKRIMRAEEKANKLPTKMTLGTMLFTVPPLLIILVGPSIYDIYVNLGGGGQ